MSFGQQSLSEQLAAALDRAGVRDPEVRKFVDVLARAEHTQAEEDEWALFPQWFKRECASRVADKGNGTRFPLDLQRKAVEYTRRRLADGDGSQAAVARDLGLPHPTLRRWMETKEAAPARQRAPMSAPSADMRMVEHGGLRVYLHKDEVMQVLKRGIASSEK